MNDKIELEINNIISESDLIKIIKKRKRQNAINSASKRCRRKQKIKLKLMDNYLNKTHINIQILYNSLNNMDIENLVKNIHSIYHEMNIFNETLKKELN
jgi:hypothetical protein